MTRNGKPRKTPPGSVRNPALEPLEPNMDRLIVGDGAPRTEAPAVALAPAKPAKPVRVPFGSYIDPELQKELRVACVVDGIEIRDALDQALRQWLASRNTT
ncbi:hypothetical protein AB0L42_42490 [Streptomyces sp. NPDC052287]|uniref:hypothetical protein n=1 Tax=Streptomyces sp. NPDC052287 TaxID=3154950 RepID=UPI00342A7C16